MLKRIFNRPAPKGSDGNDADPMQGIAPVDINERVRKKQILYFSVAAAAVIAFGGYYIFGTGEANLPSKEGEASIIATADGIDRPTGEKYWTSQSEAEMQEMKQRLATVERNNGLTASPNGGLPGQPAGLLQTGSGSSGEVSSLRQENAQMARDAQNVVQAYDSEIAGLNKALAEAKRAQAAPLYAKPPPVFASPKQLSNPASNAALAAVSNSNLKGFDAKPYEVKLVSFAQSSATIAQKPSNGNTEVTDSLNYLPPNSIAKARVIVGVDASAGVTSQSDPLPVVLRITGPARSVYRDGKLLTTRVEGCLVNGAARGDLSSEKVYVKLQRMTCPQDNGRFAVSEVKGFVSFAGKTGVRGRVVSREGSLVTQAFGAGLLGGLGRAASANTDSILQGTNITVDGKRQQLGAGEILQGGLGSGVAQSADTVSKYLIERAEQYQPVIEMPTGIDVEIVFLEGVFIQ
jgi:conjugal transfer pilus assembly protein TraB